MRDDFVVARVIAALDASCHELDLLPTAVELAARLEAEVTGLFIEDENLLRLWSLPAARHLTIGPPSREVPSAEQIEAELRALAAQAAAALSAAAARQGVPWTFRVVRGRPEEELHERTKTKDLIVVGRNRAFAGGLPLQMSSPLQDAVRRLARSTVLVPRATTVARPVAVVRPGSRLLERALAAAMRLAGPKSRELDIVLTGAPAEAARAQADITRRLAVLGYTARIVAIGEPTLDQLSRALANTEGDILVAAADLPLVGERDDMSRLLERTGLPVMLVRG